MAISLVGTPAVVTQASTPLSQSVTLAGDADIYLFVTQRGSGTTAPSAVSVGGVSATSVTGTAGGISGSSRYCGWWRIARASNPGSGSRTVAVTWAGIDNIGVGVLEFRGDGTLSTGGVAAATNDDGSLTLALSVAAVSGDVTISGAMANSGISWTPASGQTEYLESVWYSNTGHVIGVQTGAQTNANWTGSGSTGGGALVIQEASSGVTVNATGSGAGVAVAAGSVTLSASLAATGSAAAQALAAGQAAPSVSLAASGQAANLAVAAGDVAVTGADQTVAATGSGAGVATEAGSVALSASLAATGSGAAIAGAIGSAALGVTLPATGAALAVAVAAGQVTLQATLAATGSAASLAMAPGAVTVDGADELPHVLAPPERTFSDDAWDGTFADEAHLSTIYDAPANLTFAD